MRFVLPLLLFILAPLAAGALRYLPANDSRPIIRRDLLPIDVDAIRELADDLAILADGPFPKSASQLHHRAQILTLSQRLSPSQARARAIEAASLELRNRPAPDEKELKKAKASVSRGADWLTTLPDSSEGHLLGQLLLDIIKPIDPEHRALQRHDLIGAPKRWNNAIAAVAKFELERRPVIKPAPTPADSNQKKYAVTALLTEVPMISIGLEDNARPSAGLVTTSLVVTRSPFLESEEEGETPTEREPGKLVFKPVTDFAVEPLHDALLDFFDTHLEPLPSHYNLNINTDKRRYTGKNKENIAASIAMMLDSATTGRPLRRNTILFARLRANGNLEKPAQAWELLLRLEELNFPIKTRLIVGSGMLEEMTAMLVLDKASFFTKFEVLEAPTFEEARDLFYKDGKMPQPLQAASEGYLEVRQKADDANHLGTFLSHPSVETRLIKASRFSPQHLSARMLATQAVRRPAYFTRHMFAQELDRRLEPLSRFRFVIDKTSEKDVKAAYQQTRTLIDPLERYLELGEKKILSEAVSLIKKLNSVGRNASSDPDNRQTIWQRDVQNFQDKLTEFRDKLRQVYNTAPIKNE